MLSPDIGKEKRRECNLAKSSSELRWRGGCGLRSTPVASTTRYLDRTSTDRGTTLSFIIQDSIGTAQPQMPTVIMLKVITSIWTLHTLILGVVSHDISWGEWGEAAYLVFVASRASSVLEVASQDGIICIHPLALGQVRRHRSGKVGNTAEVPHLPQQAQRMRIGNEEERTRIEQRREPVYTWSCRKLGGRRVLSKSRADRGVMKTRRGGKEQQPGGTTYPTDRALELRGAMVSRAAVLGPEQVALQDQGIRGKPCTVNPSSFKGNLYRKKDMSFMKG
ncbi:hypothetical protein BDZ97DRAFT_1765409 [Flammula alnicola]|nr:hypothetical protein BDZ97DRAFT_1765409 [Flammula alnicola]